MFALKLNQNFTLSHAHFVIESVHKAVILVVSNSLPEEDRGDLVETSLKKQLCW